MSDQAIMDAAVREHQAGHPITDGQARVIAAAWHSPSNDLASLSTSGAIPGDLHLSIREEQEDYGDGPEAVELEALLAYVERHGERGPVPGWSRLWG